MIAMTSTVGLKKEADVKRKRHSGGSDRLGTDRSSEVTLRGDQLKDSESVRSSKCEKCCSILPVGQEKVAR